MLAHHRVTPIIELTCTHLGERGNASIYRVVASVTKNQVFATSQLAASRRLDFPSLNLLTSKENLPYLWMKDKIYANGYNETKVLTGSPFLI